MNIKKLRDQLKIDEGEVYKIYKDSEGFPTFGIGHLIKVDDPEYGLPIDTPVSENRVYEAFQNDICVVLRDVEKLYPDFYDLPEEVQQIVANMMFNLGLTKLSKFKGMKKGVDTRDWNKAADEMVDSRWYRQVKSRAVRLVERMRKVEEI